MCVNHRSHSVQSAIGEEQKKLKAIRDITHQRMKETTLRLEQRVQSLKGDLISLERTLHTQYKNLQPQVRVAQCAVYAQSVNSGTDTATEPRAHRTTDQAPAFD